LQILKVRRRGSELGNHARETVRENL
jgi:hypothetical protein